MVSETEWAYLAGLIDGEGCIRIERNKGKQLQGTPTVALTNSNPLMLLWVLLRFGGHLYKKKSKSCWDIYWLGKATIPLLEGMLPYLTAKKGQAELVLDYRKLVGKPGKRLTSDMIEKREAIAEAMSILKKGNQINLEVR